jgi:hypothetical protein
MFDDFRPFVFPDVIGRKVLFLGLGGGSDIILAHVLARAFCPAGTRSLISGNTKKKDEPDLEATTPHIRRLPGPVVVPRVRTHGTCAIDRSIPRGDEGCPWILLLDQEETAWRVTAVATSSAPVQLPRPAFCPPASDSVTILWLSIVHR